jgi:hypothetical protein
VLWHFKAMSTRERWAQILRVVGGVAIAAGAIEPMEGSVIVFLGSGLLTLGTLLGPPERRLMVYRLWTLALIVVGVGALWGLTSVGGFGGHSGRSMWWGVLILPYLIGLSASFWSPGTSRWLVILGILIGLWYVALPVLIVIHAKSGRPIFPVALITVGAAGTMTIAGCILRLRLWAAVQE